MAHTHVVRRSMSFEQWAKVMIDQIEKLVVCESHPTGPWSVREGYYQPEGYRWIEEARTIAHGERWGGPDVTAYFQGEAVIPEKYAGETVHFRMLTATEVIVSSERTYLDGLDPNRQWFELCRQAVPETKFPITMEAYTRSRPDDDRNPRSAALRGCVQRFTTPDLVVLDPSALELWYDLEALNLTAFGPAIVDDVKVYLQAKMRELFKRFPPYGASPQELRSAFPRIADFVRREIYDADSPFGKEGRLACVAHSHLDIAYFWKAHQTVQKNARTTLIQLRLMDRYPEFLYAHSQAWAYETLERYYPALFQEMKGRIEDGRWEIVGGLYVEPDCNVISAESLVRHILYGKSYFLEKFGIEVDNCWLPDVFGNSAIMPQILKLGKIDYFVSNKMSTWNDTNRFPHNNFVWRGLDGSEVFACVPPVHFITWMDPNQAQENWEAMQDKHIFDESLQMYGYGDGGSGATDEMIALFHRQQRLPGVPQQRLTTGKEYLHRSFAGKEGLPVWDGDLYLEMHRGTFTSKGELKKANRSGEFSLYEAELLSVLASLTHESAPFPVERFKDAWKLLLINQFHDIIPGSHVAPVTVDAIRAYEEMDEIIARLVDESVERLTERDSASACVVNPCSWVRGGPTYVTGDDVKGMPTQEITRADGTAVRAIEIAPVPGLAVSTIRTVHAHKSGELVAERERLENDFFRLEFDERGNLKQVLDKIRRRRLCPEGQVLNGWHLYEDRPGRYNAWDIVERYRDKEIEIDDGWSGVEVVESGPISVALRLSRTLSASRAVQIVRLYATVPRIDFETWVDWRETERLLKVSFPLHLKARHYTTDLSAGALELPNHRNTTWEQARFESLCHKWVDVSEGRFGVALMNDCKYGCDVRDNVLSLSLLRSPTRPDPKSDAGRHHFTYSLYLHDGQWQRSGLVREAYNLNMPLTVRPHRRAKHDGGPSIRISGEGVVVQSIKGAEDTSGDIILRVFEAAGSHTEATIRTAVPFSSVHVCDLLEREDGGALRPADGEVHVPLRPFQIATIRLRR